MRVRLVSASRSKVRCKGSKMQNSTWMLICVYGVLVKTLPLSVPGIPKKRVLDTFQNWPQMNPRQDPRRPVSAFAISGGLILTVPFTTLGLPQPTGHRSVTPIWKENPATGWSFPSWPQSERQHHHLAISKGEHFVFAYFTDTAAFVSHICVTLGIVVKHPEPLLPYQCVPLTSGLQWDITRRCLREWVCFKVLNTMHMLAIRTSCTSNDQRSYFSFFNPQRQ